MIREMVASDIPVMTELGARMHLESSYRDFNYSAEKCFKLGHAIVNSNEYCGFVSEVDGEIQGMFIGVMFEHYFSDATLSTDLLLYVSPDKRGGMTAVRLIKRYIEWAKSLGVDDIRLGETAGIDSDTVNKLYTRLGFAICGSIYKYEG